MRKATLSSIKAEGESRSSLLAPRCTDSADERGWALLGLILALAVMGIMLGAIVPNVSFQVRRDKEAELLYRGSQMATAIARYYNNGAPRNIGSLTPPPPRTALLDLDKLKEPYLVGVNEIKLVRLSATIDPMNSGDWEPVRLRDPRLGPFFQSYMAETNLDVPDFYLWMAGPPPAIITNPTDSSNPTAGSPVVTTPPDPFEHLLKDADSGPGRSNLPIIGVAPKMKGKSVRTLYGLENYEEWVFIHIDPKSLTGPPPPPPPDPK
jgi:type II secretory pathway pseudopilin PulG